MNTHEMLVRNSDTGAVIIHETGTRGKMMERIFDLARVFVSHSAYVEFVDGGLDIRHSITRDPISTIRIYSI